MRKKMMMVVLGIILGLSATAKADMVVKDKAYYDAITYTWSNSDGTYTSKLTDIATDPNQIMALLKEVWTNKNVPGIYYGAYNSSATTREGAANYTVASTSSGKGPGKRETAHTLTTTWGISNGTYTPNEEGYTTLFVKVKNTWDNDNDRTCSSTSATLNYISEAIESVQLITASTYYAASNDVPSPGALYQLTGSANRFFFISKGRARLSTGGSSETARRSPLQGMFEEYSPQLIDGTTSVTDFYAKMMNGDVYKVAHDCGSVLGNDHYFCMSGASGTDSYEITDLAFFLPDKRLVAWGSSGDGRDYQGTSTSKYTNYNQNWAPAIGLYTITLTATGTQNPDDASKWDITLNWTSKLNEITGNTVEQEFTIYTRDADGNIQPLKDSEGNIVTTKNYTYSYTVDKEEHGRTITYVVFGVPTSGVFNAVGSNDDEVEVPGLDPNERLTIGIGATSGSEYVLSKEVNHYTNYVSMANGVGTYILGHNLNPTYSPAFTFYRFPEGNASGDSVLVAVVSVTDQTTSGDETHYNYTVTYFSQEDANESLYPTNTGYFTSKGDYAEVNFNDFKICDQFNASTMYNTHPSKYEYRIGYTTEAYDSTFHSSYSSIKVYKTSATVTDTPFFLSQVAADSVCSTRMSYASENPELSFPVEMDAKVANYYARKVTKQSAEEYSEFGRAQRLPSWNYAIYEDDAYKKNITTDDEAQIVDNNFQPGTGEYVPVISTYREGEETYNTYGAPIVTATRLKVTATATPFKMTDYKFADASGNQCRYYVTSFNINAEGTDNYEIVKYRIWRKTDGQEREITAPYMQRLKQDSHPITINFNESGEPAIEASQAAEFDGGAGVTWYPEQNGEYGIYAYDAFGALDVASNGSLPVTYVVRLYSKPASASAAKAAHRKVKRNAAAETEAEYYVAETEVTVTFNSSIPTGIIETDATEKVPANVRYVNMLGQESDKPYEGVNVVITTYTDGSISKAKQTF